MSSEIEQIEDKIIAEIQRTAERTGYPMIGIENTETWSGSDIEEMLRSILTPEAARVIYAGDTQGEIKVMGGGDAHNENMLWRIALVMTNLRSQAAGSRAGYVYIEAMKKCFARFLVTPFRGYLHHTKTELLYVGKGKHVYGFELERSIGK